MQDGHSCVVVVVLSFILTLCLYGQEVTIEGLDVCEDKKHNFEYVPLPNKSVCLCLISFGSSV